MLNDFLGWLKLAGGFDWQIEHQRMFPEADPSLRDVPTGLHPQVYGLLENAGIERVYSHQAEAIELAKAGNDIVVSTSTASGKTLCFQIPVLDRLLSDPNARALFLFPLKALERDQLESFLALAGDSGITAAVYDGDTPEPERRRIKHSPPRVLITNPDMLHLGMLGYHDTWKSFFENLSFIVLDEVHTYKGIFGSHISQVLLRTLRICKRWSATPQFIACSATIANPGSFVSTLINREVSVVDSSGAPSSERHFIFLRPHLSLNVVATKLFIKALKSGLKTIVFTRARKITELITTWVNQWAPELKDRVSSYRAGFLPEERREIESKLFAGEMDGVISTSALEMGIDVGGLDLCILVGYPGTVINTWQRGGRVGRAGKPSAITLIAGEDALDHYFMNNPDDFFQRSCEEAVLDPYNKEVLKKHLLCAAAEVPITEDEAFAAIPEVKDAIVDLETAGALFRSKIGLHSTVMRPQRNVDLRGIGESFGIFLEESRKLIGSSSGIRVFTECHEGAIYLHRAQQFLVKKLDLERRNISVSPARLKYYTKALSEKTTEVMGTPIRSKDVAGFSIKEARLKVTEVITSYEKRRVSGQELIGVVELQLPPVHFETIGIWIEIPDSVKEVIEKSGLHFMGGIHSLEHAAISMFPLFALCDRNDIGGISTTQHEQVCKATVFIYDGHPGGVGLSHRAFDIIEDLLLKTKTLVETCECLEGCPSCIHSPKCGSGNKPLDKEACIQTLRMLLNPDLIHEPIVRKTPVRNLVNPEVLDGKSKPPKKMGTAEAGVKNRKSIALPQEQPVSWFQAASMALKEKAEKRRRILLFPEFAPENEASAGETSKSPGKPAARKAPSAAPKRRGIPIPAVEVKNPYTGKIIFFDLETQRLANEVGGWANIHRMGLSVAVTCNEDDGFKTFTEETVDDLVCYLQSANLVVGFNHVRFDYEVLKAYTKENLRRLPNLDMLLEVQQCLGFRLKLDHLAKHTLGRCKIGDGIDAPKWFREGNMELLEKYCREDVALTRDLFTFGAQNGYLMFQDKENVVCRFRVNWRLGLKVKTLP